MRSVTYKSVLQMVGVLWTGEEDVSVEDALTLGRFINKKAREYWEKFFWPELVTVEKRYFRPVWSSGGVAATVTAGSEWYHPASGKYFQALKVTTTEPADENGDPTDHWADAESDYSEEEWDDAATYDVGDRFLYSVNGVFYQAHTTGAPAGTVPTDTTYFGPLTEFRRDIDFEQTLAGGTSATAIGEVKKVWDRDPTVHEDAQSIAFNIDESGVLVRGCQAVVWVQFRYRCPAWRGETYDAQTANTAGQVRYYEAADVTDAGDFYRCTTANTGQAPAASGGAVNSDYWTKIEFPYVLAEMVAQGAYGELLKHDGQHEKWGLEMREADRLYQNEVLKIERLQGQSKRLNVQLR